MSIKDIATAKALRSRCDKCKLCHSCTQLMTIACLDNYVKGFLNGYKYKQNLKPR